ncbi:MAG: malectin domain-containing carbohydrate-binding protein [Bryobacteraceae bacterium]|nr:malectin domain-containing carbohydrate-binding protein [Bryobacteraceae bacterium]
MSDLRIQPARQEAERAALEELLRSGLFDRAPGLGRLLVYICNKYFNGEADQIKEYNIAVEALGRSAEFDQKKDSIVRVEAHRLRKRLQQYYAKDGAGAPVQICIPEGRYVPKFVFVEDRVEPALNGDAAEEGGPGRLEVPALTSAGEARLPAAEALVPVLAVEVVEAPTPRRLATREERPRNILVPAILAAAVLMLLLVGWYTNRQPIASAPEAERLELPPLTDSRQPIRILAGRTGGHYLDRFGREWMDDRYFNGGEAVRTALLPGLRAPDAGLYATRREGEFSYDIPVEPGLYEVHLHFAETVFGEGNPAGGGETSRLFDVMVNEDPVLTTFDVIADASGSRREDVKVLRDVEPGADGKLHLRFRGRKEVAFVNAIEVLPGIAGRMRPIRYVAQEQFHTDRQGRVWSPDSSIVSGGVLVARPEGPKDSAEQDLYRGERYGHFTYVIPVAPGKYTLHLHFAESWFGTGKPGGGGAGSRVFEVSCNDRPLLTGFDVSAQAGGSGIALRKTFSGLAPNPQGKLVLHFMPVKNYAFVNAIEVVAENTQAKAGR